MAKNKKKEKNTMRQIPIRAAVCRKFGAPLCIENLLLSPPAARQVRVKLAVCAICHSDIIYMDGGWGGETPAVFGHEAAGTVADSGADSGFSPGERVLVTLLRSCGECAACQRGIPAKCAGKFDESPMLFDTAGAPVQTGLRAAAFAEQVTVDRSQLARIPDFLPFAEASLLSCGVLTGWGAVVNTAAVSPGESVAVLGCGGVGLNCVQAAAQAGAVPLLAADLSDAALETARQFGATDALNAGQEGFAGAAKSLTDGRGFEYVFMAAGSGRAVEQAASLLAPLGKLTLVGMPPNGDLAALDVLRIANEHQQILGSKMGGCRLRVDIPRLLNLYQHKRLKLTELINNRYPLDDINEAIRVSRNGALRNIICLKAE